MARSAFWIGFLALGALLTLGACEPQTVIVVYPDATTTTDTGGSDTPSAADTGGSDADATATDTGPAECESADDCDDSQPCTTDRCTSGRCEHSALANGSECDDADEATIDDSCSDGVCAGTDCGGVVTSCNDGAIDARTGECVAAPRADGTTCPDGACQGGACVPTDVSATCEAYCVAVIANCTGSYASKGACLETCATLAGWDEGTPGATDGNTLACRQTHADAAATDAAASCDAASASGGGRCGSWCDTYCALQARNCADLYADATACATACEGLSDGGDPGDSDGDSVQCRIGELLAAAVDPADTSAAAHCPNAAADGGEVCVAAEAPGTSCETPRSVPTIPYEASGDTSDSGDNYNVPADGCYAGGASGAGNDQVWVFIPPQSASYKVEVDGDSAFVVSILRDCGDWEGCVGAAAGDDALVANLLGGETYYLVVDGQGAEDAGAYSLVVDAAECQVRCGDRLCGPDGCGGSCGACAGANVCGATGECVDPGGLDGTKCETSFVVDALPFEDTRAMANGTNAVDPRQCPISVSASNDSSDVVWTFTPAATGIYPITATVEPHGINQLWVVSDCLDTAGTCVAKESGAYGVGPIDPLLEAGVTYFIGVDASLAGASIGEVSIRIEAACTPHCEGRQCGPDGCGGICGSCAAEAPCAAGQCKTADEVQGNTCATPTPIGAVPFQGEGDTQYAGSNYRAGDLCPANLAGYGTGPDSVYSFTPSAAGDYAIRLDTSLTGPQVVYVMELCEKLAAGDDDPQCLDGKDFFSSADPLVVTLEAGKTYFIIVDDSPYDQGPYVLSVEAAVP